MGGCQAKGVPVQKMKVKEPKPKKIKIKVEKEEKTKAKKDKEKKKQKNKKIDSDEQNLLTDQIEVLKSSNQDNGQNISNEQEQLNMELQTITKVEHSTQSHAPELGTDKDSAKIMKPQKIEKISTITSRDKEEKELEQKLQKQLVDRQVSKEKLFTGIKERHEEQILAKACVDKSQGVKFESADKVETLKVVAFNSNYEIPKIVLQQDSQICSSEIKHELKLDASKCQNDLKDKTLKEKQITMQSKENKVKFVEPPKFEASISKNIVVEQKSTQPDSPIKIKFKKPVTPIEVKMDTIFMENQIYKYNDSEMKMSSANSPKFEPNLAFNKVVECEKKKTEYKLDKKEEIASCRENEPSIKLINSIQHDLFPISTSTSSTSASSQSDITKSNSAIESVDIRQSKQNSEILSVVKVKPQTYLEKTKDNIDNMPLNNLNQLCSSDLTKNKVQLNESISYQTSLADKSINENTDLIISKQFVEQAQVSQQNTSRNTQLPQSICSPSIQFIQNSSIPAQYNQHVSAMVLQTSPQMEEQIFEKRSQIYQPKKSFKMSNKNDQYFQNLETITNKNNNLIDEVDLINQQHQLKRNPHSKISTNFYYVSKDFDLENNHKVEEGYKPLISSVNVESSINYENNEGVASPSKKIENINNISLSQSQTSCSAPLKLRNQEIINESKYVKPNNLCIKEYNSSQIKGQEYEIKKEFQQYSEQETIKSENMRPEELTKSDYFDKIKRDQRSSLDTLQIIVKFLLDEVEEFQSVEAREQLNDLIQHLSSSQQQLDDSVRIQKALEDKLQGLQNQHYENLKLLQSEHEKQLKNYITSNKSNTAENVSKKDDHRIKQIIEEELGKEHSRHEKEISEIKNRHDKDVQDIVLTNARTIENLKQEYNEKIETLKICYEARINNVTKHYEYIKYHLTDLLVLLQQDKNSNQNISSPGISGSNEGSDLLRGNKEDQQRKPQVRVSMVQQLSEQYENLARGNAGVIEEVPRQKYLQQEVDSLRSVMDLRNREISQLRLNNQDMEKKLDEIPKAQATISSMQHKIENLEAIIQKKVAYEKI